METIKVGDTVCAVPNAPASVQQLLGYGVTGRVFTNKDTTHYLVCLPNGELYRVAKEYVTLAKQSPTKSKDAADVRYLRQGHNLSKDYCEDDEDYCEVDLVHSRQVAEGNHVLVRTAHGTQFLVHKAWLSDSEDDRMPPHELTVNNHKFSVGGSYKVIGMALDAAAYAAVGTLLGFECMGVVPFAILSTVEHNLIIAPVTHLSTLAPPDLQYCEDMLRSNDQ